MPTSTMLHTALHLTRSGRLLDATAAIQAGLRGTTGLSTRTQPTRAPQPAEAPSPASSRFETHHLAHEAATRRYKLFVPAGTWDTPRPLVVMLHGCTQTPDDFAAGTQMNERAGEAGVLVAYPEQGRDANIAKCWNWFRPGDQVRDGGEPGLIAAIARQIMSDHRIDPDRVFVAGLSAGGAAAAIMAQNYPDLFAAVGVHSGLACGAAHDLPSALTAMKTGAAGRTTGSGVPAIVFHGTADGTVHPNNARHLLSSIDPALTIRETVVGRSKGGIDYTRAAYADAGGRLAAEIWTLDGVGHAWSGGSPAGSYTDPRGPDASREMLRFFLQQRVHRMTAVASG